MSTTNSNNNNNMSSSNNSNNHLPPPHETTTSNASSFLPAFMTTPPTTLPTTEEDFRKALQEAFVQGTQAATLPKSPEEFAQALQEAFKRGAQAAVVRKPALSTVVSCPDLYRAASPVGVLSSVGMMSTAAATAAVVPVTSMNTATMNLNTSATALLHHNNPTTEQQHHRLLASLPPEIRSFSMPDMTALQQEDVKRQNRLARNRASARQRRLRKKCLVESYEAQVIALEQRLQKLHQLQWDNSVDTVALLNALSLDRGQDELTLHDRQQAAAQALAQQLQAVLQLEEGLEEQFVVYQVAMGDPVYSQELGLDLTDEQRLQLQAQAQTWQDDWDELQTTKEMLQALQEHEWLWKNGIQEAAEPFKSLLSKQQRTKWYIWADANGEALEELYVVEPKSAMDGPVFQFGTEDLMPDDAAKMKQQQVSAENHPASADEGQFDWVF